jgi:starvation-inducible DNA-binding protein
MSNTIRNFDAIQITEKLNELLANYHVHYQKLRNFHWTVYGENFFELHRQFEEQYNEIKMQIDEIAERILTLGLNPFGTMQQYLVESEIKEVVQEITPSEMVGEIVRDYEVMIPKIRKVIDDASKAGDEGTIDMLAGYLKDFEKRRWMMRAFLQKKANRAEVA